MGQLKQIFLWSWFLEGFLMVQVHIDNLFTLVWCEGCRDLCFILEWIIVFEISGLFSSNLIMNSTLITYNMWRWKRTLTVVSVSLRNIALWVLLIQSIPQYTLSSHTLWASADPSHVIDSLYGCEVFHHGLVLVLLHLWLIYLVHLVLLPSCRVWRRSKKLIIPYAVVIIWPLCYKNFGSLVRMFS